MESAHRSASEQPKLWNGAGGNAWVDLQPLLDRLFGPIEDLLVQAALARPRRRVLDVGCGTGSTTRAVARSLGANSQCVGVDLSEPMIAAARTLADREAVPAQFMLADAQIHAFEPAAFDLIMSRFGVMFFDDPVTAFANLRRGATADAELRFVAWRGAAENTFMTTAERAAAPLLPNLPVRVPDAPGQFAFADARRVHHILRQSGWAEIDIQPVDVACALPEKDLLPYLTRLGPLGQALPAIDEPMRTRVIETVRAAFEPYVHGDQVCFNAACWIVGALAASPAAGLSGLTNE